MEGREIIRHDEIDSTIKDIPLKFRTVWLIIRTAGLVRWTFLFVFLLFLATLIVDVTEPAIGGFGNAAWLMFQVVTTIGFGDFTPDSIVGRVAIVCLSAYSLFFLALVTGAVVSYCQERILARRNQSIAHFVDQLEHLPELSHEELVVLSKQVKRIHQGVRNI